MFNISCVHAGLSSPCSGCSLAQILVLLALSTQWLLSDTLSDRGYVCLTDSLAAPLYCSNMNTKKTFFLFMKMIKSHLNSS